MSATHKTLTITYYVDPRDLKSITVSMRSAQIILGLATTLVLWSAGALIYILLSPSPKLAAHSLTAVPELENNTTVVQAEATSVAEVSESHISLRKIKPTAKGNTSVVPVALVNPTFEEENNQLVLSFGIENTGDLPISGHVWGFAQFTDKDGKVETVASHPLLDKGAPDADSNLTYAVTYKARLRSLKDLRFPLPEGGFAALKDVSIYVRDTSMLTPINLQILPPPP